MKDQAIFIREETAYDFALRLSEKLKGTRPVFEEDLV